MSGHYRIARFPDVFVRSQAARDRSEQGVGRLPWISLPLKNGAGLLEVLSHDDGLALYGAFVLLARAAADTETRGVFVRHGRAMTLPEIARLAMIPTDRIEDLVTKLMAAGWVEKSDSTSVPASDLAPKSDLKPDPQSDPKPDSGSDLQSRTLSPTQSRTDGTGRDETRREKDTVAPPRVRMFPKRGFRKPTLDELRAHLSAIGSDIDPVAFLAYYEANGWRVGRNPMKNWKAAVETWIRRRNA